MRRWSWTVAMLAAGTYAIPAGAQQAVSAGPATLTLPPQPTDAGKPVIYDPQFVAKSEDDSGCAVGSPCRLRLFGVIQNNGAVELRGTVFTW